MNLKLEIDNFNFDELYRTLDNIIENIKFHQRKRTLNPPSHSPVEPKLNTSQRKQRLIGEVHTKIDSEHMPNSPFKTRGLPSQNIYSHFSPKAKKSKVSEDAAYSPYSPIKYT